MNTKIRNFRSTA